MSASRSIVRLKFIFPNRDGATVKAAYSATTTVREVKSDVLLHRWPEEAFGVAAEKVGKLRMFYAGRELRDNQQLCDCKFLSSDDPEAAAACHLFVILKGAEKEKENAKPSRCLCHIS